MNKIIKLYRERYYISPLDLADAAEANRIHLMFISPFLFLFGIINLPLFMIIYRNSLREHPTTFIYYGGFALVSLYIYIHSFLAKNAPREKAYILKNIPAYIGFFLFLGSGILGVFDSQPFNGLITYALTDILALCLFSFSPLLFLFSHVLGICIMAPVLYDAFELMGLMNVILASILLVCLSLYKRRTEKKIIMLLRKQKQNLEAKTFGNFTLLYGNKMIKFSRTKSYELLAYLIYLNGSSVRTKELLKVLYGLEANSSSNGANLRNLIADIKHTLAELEIHNFFITEYNNFRINPEVVQCDYYDLLAGKSQAIKSYTGEFMSQYDWAEEAKAFMSYKVLNKTHK